MLIHGLLGCKQILPELVGLLYISLIRPHLEYAVPVWNPYLRKDIEKLENVQHRASRLCPGISKKSYEERLRALRLTTLETRRKRGDLIQFYKSLNGLDRIEWMNELLKVDRGVNLRNGGVSFHREPANITTERDQFFINRVIPLWNNLHQALKV